MYWERKKEELDVLGFLTKETKTKNNREELLKEVLLDNRITSWYEPHSFITYNLRNSDGKEREYPPDFITSVFRNGKQIMFEWHSSISLASSYFKKVKNVAQTYGFYVVFITPHKKNKKLNKEGAAIQEPMVYTLEGLGEIRISSRPRAISIRSHYAFECSILLYYLRFRYFSLKLL